MDKNSLIEIHEEGRRHLAMDEQKQVVGEIFYSTDLQQWCYHAKTDYRDFAVTGLEKIVAYIHKLKAQKKLLDKLVEAKEP